MRRASADIVILQDGSAVLSALFRELIDEEEQRVGILRQPHLRRSITGEDRQSDVVLCLGTLVVRRRVELSWLAGGALVALLILVSTVR